MSRVCVVAGLVALSLVGCAEERAKDGGGPAEAKADSPALNPKLCGAPDPLVCRIAAEQFGDSFIEGSGGGGKGPRSLAVTINFRAKFDVPSTEYVRLRLEQQMAETYNAYFGSRLAPQIKYVELTAYAPGAEPFEDFPLYATSVGFNEYVPGLDPSQYWRVDSIDPALRG